MLHLSVTNTNLGIKYNVTKNNVICNKDVIIFYHFNVEDTLAQYHRA